MRTQRGEHGAQRFRVRCSTWCLRSAGWLLLLAGGAQAFGQVSVHLAGNYCNVARSTNNSLFRRYFLERESGPLAAGEGEADWC